MKNLKLESRISEISDESKSKKNNKKHNMMAIEIFYPLYHNIIYIDTFENNLPIIRLNTKIRDSLYYDDGIEHLKQSIHKFLPKFNEIEKKVNEYNTNLTKFHNDLMERHTSNLILKKGFEVTYNTNIDTPSNTINLTILLPELKLFWFGEKTDIPVTRYNNSLRIPIGVGHAEIATVINEMNDKQKMAEEIKVKNLVNELKDLYEIKQDLQKFKQDIVDIYYKSEELSKDIGKNIIKLIELDEYDDMCTICKKIK